MAKAQLKTIDEVLARQLEDPGFREYWERTAVARAVAIWLTTYRAEHGLSQTGLAHRLGMTQPAVARLESGEHAPKMETLLRLADVLGIELRVDIIPPSRPKRRRGQVVESLTTGQGSRLMVEAS